MNAQYTININYHTIKNTSGIDINVIEPIIIQMSDEMKKVGWSVHQDTLQEGLNLRFWLSEKEINETVEKELENRMKGFRGIIANSMNKILGNQSTEQSLTMARNILKQKFENQASKEIEKELSGLIGIEGITVIKGNQPLFENHKNNSIKIKM